MQARTSAIAAEFGFPCTADNSRHWASHRGGQHLRRSLSWLARHMEQSRLRLLAEFESLRFAERASCEVMPTPGSQPRNPQTVAPARPHRLASLWGGLASRTQSPFAQPSQQSRPFDSDTSIYAAKSSLASLPKTQTPTIQVREIIMLSTANGTSTCMLCVTSTVTVCPGQMPLDKLILHAYNKLIACYVPAADSSSRCPVMCSRATPCFIT